MNGQKYSWWVYAGALLFVILNGLFIYHEVFWFTIFPVVLLLVAAAFLSLDKLILALVFMVPLSVPLSELVKDLPIDMFLPTEPLLAGILLIVVLKLIFNGNFDKKVLTHPVTLTLYLYLFWMLVTTVTSTMPLVSAKFLLAKLWFIAAFYLLATQLFRSKANARKYMTYYVFALVIVVGYAMFRHLKFGIFDEKIAHWSANPFYKDHTSYGALLAFYIPPMVGISLYKKYPVRRRYLFAVLTLILFVGLVFSYSRAAWVSLLGAFGVWVLIKLRIKFWLVFSGALLLGMVVLAFGNNIMRSLESNKQDSSTDLAEHVQSISNVSTDASNLERLNRWNCALRMFAEKPVFGWGPGTYTFHYAPFQLSHEKTIISTNQGDMGNAHSEYLGPLSEQGVMGMLSFILIIVTTLITGIRAIRRTADNELAMLGLAAIVGLVTYYLHGILNNFLDTDKASVPFWGFTALLVAIDIYYRKSDAKNPG